MYKSPKDRYNLTNKKIFHLFFIFVGYFATTFVSLSNIFNKLEYCGDNSSETKYKTIKKH